MLWAKSDCIFFMLPLRNIWENRQRASAFDGFDDKPLFSFCLYFCIGIFGAIRFLAICFICLHFGANGFCVEPVGQFRKSCRQLHFLSAAYFRFIFLVFFEFLCVIGVTHTQRHRDKRWHWTIQNCCCQGQGLRGRTVPAHTHGKRLQNKKALNYISFSRHIKSISNFIPLVTFVFHLI